MLDLKEVKLIQMYMQNIVMKKIVIIVLYVDDLIITGDYTHDIEITKDQIEQVF